jgi:UDP:flavonoid glycosyltransferase YjiC (YdhE family)
MRILFTFAGGSGHFHPLVPIARAAVTAGHVVAFGCGPGMARKVEAEGFLVFATGVASAGGTPTRTPLRPLDPDEIDREVRDSFAGRMARARVGQTLDLGAAWRPDLIVCDEMDFGSMVAAERLDLPYATVLVIAAGSLARPDLIAEPLHDLRAEYDLPADPELAMLSRYLVLSPFPPGYRDPACAPPATAHALRSVEPEPAADQAVPPWLGRDSGRPSVYLTLGTEFNMESGDLFPRLIAGLRELDINLLVTVGQQIDPDEFGRQPDHVHVERYIPQALILPRCDLVVSHGGSGSVIGALAHGLPMVLAPMGADQPLNAARCAALGVAQVLDALTVTPETAGTAVATGLADASYRRAAERIRDEIATLPGPDHAVRLLERLAAEKAPLVAV